MPYEFHLKTPMILAGSALFAGWLASELRRRAGRAPHPAQRWASERLPVLAEAHYRASLAALLAAFVLAASLAKFSQLRALVLNAEDFWLFQDMLAQMMRGGFFMTRYAPQALGWVQHGAVHPMLSWAIALPLAWILGPTAAALLFGPLVFAGAAAMLAMIARPRLGALGAWLVAAGFLASSQVGRVLMYDVHPEAAYPLFVLLWAWAAGWGDHKTRPVVLLMSTVLLMGVKEDSFAVLLPLIAATAFFLPGARRGWLATSAALAVSLCLLQFHAVHQLASGAWGPAQWQGSPVALPRGAELLRNRHWDNLSSAVEITGGIVSEKGGVLGTAASLLRFLFSRPWLSLLLVAPWVVALPAFWISVLPLAGIYALLDEPGKFINYYSAPVLGLFWLGAISSRFRRPTHFLWIFGVALVLGGGGIDFYRATDAASRAREEVRDKVSCLPAHARGVVSGRFVGLVSPDQIFSDRVPADRLETADFYLFSKALPSFEIPPAAAGDLLRKLVADPRWMPVGRSCRPLGPDENPVAILFAKRS